MTNQFNRRKFVTTATIAGCTFLVAGFKGFAHQQNQIPDPQKINYCGYTCPKDCVFLEASVKNDVELKKKAYETWEMKERFGVQEFEPDKIFCFGCKTKDKPVGIRLQKCDVRNCAIEKNLESCIECSDLKACGKDLWKKFPDFKNAVIKMQQVYHDHKG